MLDYLNSKYFFLSAGSDQLPPTGREGRGDHADTSHGGLGQPPVFRPLPVDQSDLSVWSFHEIILTIRTT